MVFDVKPKTEKFKVQNLPGVPEHVYFTDCLGSRDEQVQNPIVGSWFRIEQGPPTAPPKYEYDEVGIVIEGIITLQDEDDGTKNTVTAEDVFVIHRGSTIAFSTSDYGIAFKCGSRLMARLWADTYSRSDAGLVDIVLIKGSNISLGASACPGLSGMLVEIAKETIFGAPSKHGRI